MKIPKLKRLGHCSACNQMVDLSPDSNAFTDHMLNGVRCPNSRYSALKIICVIESPEEAMLVAQFIKEDNLRCLYFHKGHSLRCGDGKYCEETRHRLARALAVYYMDLHAQEQLH